MNILNENDSVFFIIDVQEKLLNAIFNKEVVSKNCGILAKASNILDIPVIITEQYPKGLGTTFCGIKDFLSEKCRYYEKTSFNALDDKNIIENLEELSKKNIVVFGIETHICVHQTVAALIEKGYNVTVIRDACGSRSENEYSDGLRIMERNGAAVKTTEMVLFELIKGAKHPHFKEIQELIK